jgi:hypothetical protein
MLPRSLAVLAVVLAEQVTDPPCDLVIGQRAVKRNGMDAVEQRQQLGDAVAPGLMRWEGVKHGAS